MVEIHKIEAIASNRANWDHRMQLLPILGGQTVGKNTLEERSRRGPTATSSLGNGGEAVVS